MANRSDSDSDDERRVENKVVEAHREYFMKFGKASTILMFSSIAHKDPTQQYEKLAGNSKV